MEGAELLGDLEFSGIGEPVERQDARPARLLEAKMHTSNCALYRSLREDINGSWLCENALQEARLGRMSMPAVWNEGEQLNILVQPRFVVEQTRTNGTVKLRSIDHFSWSPKNQGKACSVNGHISAAEKMKHHTLDTLASVMKEFHALMLEPPGLIKADIESAFRRVPISSKSRWACGVAWKARGKVWFDHDVCTFWVGFVCCRYITRSIGRAR